MQHHSRKRHNLQPAPNSHCMQYLQEGMDTQSVYIAKFAFGACVEGGPDKEARVGTVRGRGCGVCLCCVQTSGNGGGWWTWEFRGHLGICGIYKENKKNMLKSGGTVGNGATIQNFLNTCIARHNFLLNIDSFHFSISNILGYTLLNITSTSEIHIVQTLSNQRRTRLRRATATHPQRGSNYNS